MVIAWLLHLSSIVLLRGRARPPLIVVADDADRAAGQDEEIGIAIEERSCHARPAPPLAVLLLRPARPGGPPRRPGRPPAPPPARRARPGRSRGAAAPPAPPRQSPP